MRKFHEENKRGVANEITSLLKELAKNVVLKCLSFCIAMLATVLKRFF